MNSIEKIDHYLNAANKYNDLNLIGILLEIKKIILIEKKGKK